VPALILVRERPVPRAAPRATALAAPPSLHCDFVPLTHTAAARAPRQLLLFLLLLLLAVFALTKDTLRDVRDHPRRFTLDARPPRARAARAGGPSERERDNEGL
jgi:hypothetical protein